MVLVKGIWLRRRGDKVQVLAEVVGKGPASWRVVIEEPFDAAFSHIVEPSGILSSPNDTVTNDARS